MKYIKGLLFGIGYGLSARGLFALEGTSYLGTNGLMTFSFMFIVPFVVGLITAHQHRSVTSAGKITFVDAVVCSYWPCVDSCLIG